MEAIEIKIVQLTSPTSSEEIISFPLCKKKQLKSNVLLTFEKIHLFKIA